MAPRDLGGELLRRLLGRRMLVRAGESLLHVGRLSSPNTSSANGELLLQRSIVSRCAAEFGGTLVAFDVGANVGGWTGSLLAQCEEAGVTNPRVHAFEPGIECHGEFEENLRAAGRERHVSLIGKAVAEECSEREFYFVPGSRQISSLVPQFESPGELRTVETLTVDTYCREHAVSRIHLLKIDVEGGDMEVLRGARGMLELRAIEVLQFEYNHRWILTRNFVRDAFELLGGMGYRVGLLTPQGVDFFSTWHRRLENFQQANYAACLPEAARWIPVPRGGTPDAAHW